MATMKRMSGTDPVEILHLYAQNHWHSPAAISGSHEGLRRLRDALDAAMNGGSGRAEVMTDDGEGYVVAVMREGPQTMGEWSGGDHDRGLPNTDEEAGSPPSASFWKRVMDIVVKR